VFDICAPLAGLAPTMQILFSLMSLAERSSSAFLQSQVVAGSREALARFVSPLSHLSRFSGGGRSELPCARPRARGSGGRGRTSRLFGWHILAYLDLSWLISSHIILFILPAEHYSFYQPNTLVLAPAWQPRAAAVAGVSSPAPGSCSRR
jgi:hypothetical protein